jgi:hypothetical protein
MPETQHNSNNPIRFDRINRLTILVNPAQTKKKGELSGITSEIFSDVLFWGNAHSATYP